MSSTFVPNPSSFGIVIIGRNEGQRLVRCLAALPRDKATCVYVDSGSSDGSPAAARAAGIDVIELDRSKPFTAARGRNAGMNLLTAKLPQLQFIQFLDGDCELTPGWVEVGTRYLDEHPEVGVVIGGRTERHMTASWYNTLLGIEWGTPLGRIKFSGGCVLCRLSLLNSINAFNEDLIAGEDPDFCVRVRATGALIWRHEAHMLTHDGSMTRFGQWWNRQRRGGYAFAIGYRLHGRPPERHCRRELISVLRWTVVVPIIIALAMYFVSPWAIGLVLAYPLQVVRLALRGEMDRRTNWIYAFMVTLGKWPEFLGVMNYLWDRIRHRSRGLVEYK